MNNIDVGLPELLVILVFGAMAFAVALIPLIFFALTLQKALDRCAPENRAMSPRMVWLLLIPFFNLIWNFIVVTRMAATLESEFRMRQIPIEQNPGQGIGIAYAILFICTFVPLLGLLAGFACLVCWIIYWVKIAECSGRLAASRALPA